MKIVVLSHTGSTGKSTIAREVFASRMPQPVTHIEFENSNFGSYSLGTSDVKKMIPSEIDGAFVYDTNINNSVVLEIGASVINDALAEFHKRSNILSFADAFVIPVVVGDDKNTADTAKTLFSLSKLDVAPEKIRLFWNRFEESSEKKIDRQIDTIAGLVAKAKCGIETTEKILTKDYILPNFDVLADMLRLRMTSKEFEKPEYDYNELLKKLIAHKDDPKMAKSISNKIDIASMATKLNERCQFLYEKFTADMAGAETAVNKTSQK